MRDLLCTLPLVSDCRTLKLLTDRRRIYSLFLSIALYSSIFLFPIGCVKTSISTKHPIMQLNLHFGSRSLRRMNPIQMIAPNGNCYAESYTTKVFIRSTDWKIDHSSPIHLIGSCFTDTISTALRRQKFNCFVNGQGIMFNPLSIKECLENIIERKVFTPNDLFLDSLNDDTYHSWSHHSSYSSLSVPSMLSKMNEDIIAGHDNLIIAKTLFITLGTARVHILKSTNKAVSNCHKQPANLFEKKLLSVSEIVDTLRESFIESRKINPDLKIVLTVSPVRHTKEGIAENSLSKSTLICAVHTLIQEFPSFLYYFPSYEIFIDELRDYRWYGKDLIHPSEVAQEIIYQKFSDCFFSDKALESVKRISSLHGTSALTPAK